MTDVQREIDARLGAAIRSLRRNQRSTLVELAHATGLSHPFLSQIERGRARPSMRSLFLIAEALGTTQQALIAAAAPDEAPDREPQRGDQGVTLDMASGTARLLLNDEAGVDITEFADIGPEFEDFFSHARDEFVYVASGTLEVEMRAHEDAESTFALLNARDSIGYPGTTLHRFRSAGPQRCIIIVVHSGSRTARHTGDPGESPTSSVSSG
jgi:transcriptional regulator with XRE-family HTH domain